METILVVGGAGYIGSHMVLCLQKAGYTVVVLDDLSSGHRDKIFTDHFVVGSSGSSACLDQIFTAYNITAVFHFAAYIEVGESVSKPEKYYQNNVLNTFHLIEKMRSHGVNTLIFSSTAAVYGHPRYLPMDEAHPRDPVSPYGHSKNMVEQILEDYERAYGFRSMCFRYFNACGADPQGRTGEDHQPESHLIPLVMQVASGHRKDIHIFGRDYNTPDGTCIRDYVHVVDLCDAHLQGLRRLQDTGVSAQYNLGSQKGYSVQQVIDMASKVSGREISTVLAQRREGDPAQLIANSAKAKKDLQWRPQYSDLETILQHAWKWELKLRRLDS